MLEYLRIKNLALIENMELEFAPGLNVLTGETGAGKSFILKALGFLLGDKLGHDIVRPGSDKAQVEALFVLPEREIILRRELSAQTGRSRFFINDVLHSQTTLKNLRNTLILHTSQHGQQKLLNPAYQAAFIDEALEPGELLFERCELAEKLATLSKKRAELLARQRDLSDKREYLEMQKMEIDRVNPSEGEEEKLEQLKAGARDSAQKIRLKERLLTVFHGEAGTVGLLNQFAQADKILGELTQLDEDMQPEASSFSEFRSILSVIDQRLRSHGARSAEDVDIDAIEERLYTLAQLKRKLRRSLDEIVGLREEIDQNISFLDLCGLELKNLDSERDKTRAALAGNLAALVPARREAGNRIAEALEKELDGLGFPKGMSVKVDYYPQEIEPDLVDERARILFAPNPGHPPQPLDRIASGGELSRFLLAIVGIQEAPESATYIFDEVDAGIGGITLNRVADRLEELAKRRQMLLITHWPNLARRADRHFQVSKQVLGEETFTQCSPLNAEEVERELTRMAGGV